MFDSEATLHGDRVPGHPLSAVPTDCWHKFTLTYPGGDTVVFVFAERGPGSETNYRETILRTQMCTPSTCVAW